MKKVALTLSLLIMVTAVFVLSGCSVEPYEVEWYFEYYKLDGETYHVGFNDYDHFGSIVSDAVTLSFAEDKTFTFKSYDGTVYEGTYKYKNRRGDTEVTLFFFDGRRASGTCARYMFDGVWYKAIFEIFGVTYYFDGDEYSFDLDSRLASVADEVYSFSGRNELSYRELIKAEVMQVNGHNIVVTDYDIYPLADESYWCYTYNENKELKQSVLVEGKCIARIEKNGKRIAIYYPENEQTETEN